MFRNLILFILLFSSTFTLIAQRPTETERPLHTYKIKNSKQLHRFFTYREKDRPLISGHRGGMMEGFPENCIPSFVNTLKHTPAFFEIDPRLTKDGVVVLMHDATLDRTTTGTGKVSDFTWEELRELRLKDKYGNETDYHIPTLEEVIRWAKGKTVVNLDKKDVPLEMTTDLIQKLDASSHVMVTVHTAEQALYYYQRIPDIMFSAFVKSPEALESYEEAGIPWNQVMAYIGPEIKPGNQEMYRLLHARGVKCMISSASTYDKLEEREERAQLYRDIMEDGADVIESDLPVEVAEAIERLLPNKPTNKKFFRE